DAQRIAGDWRDLLGERVLGAWPTSSATGAGIDELRRAILDAVPAEGAAATDPRAAGDEPRFGAEDRGYRPGGDQGFRVVREDDGAFRVEGRGIEVLAKRHDLDNHEAMAYLEGRLREIGVIAALRSAGFEPGDEVRIGEVAFDLDPG